MGNREFKNRAACATGPQYLAYTGLNPDARGIRVRHLRLLGIAPRRFTKKSSTAQPNIANRLMQTPIPIAVIGLP
jgi:hypothetical protein